MPKKLPIKIVREAYEEELQQLSAYKLEIRVKTSLF
jgi:hypothetical protein